MTALQEPFRYDYVGSFLRPEKVKNAKALYEDGKIEKEELDETINEAIREVVAKQKDLGFHVITDGEFRRTYWHLDFMWGFEGVAHELTGGGVQFAGELASLEDTYVVGKIKAKAHPFVEYFKFLKYSCKIYNSSTGTDVPAVYCSAECGIDKKILCDR